MLTAAKGISSKMNELVMYESEENLFRLMIRPYNIVL